MSSLSKSILVHEHRLKCISQPHPSSSESCWVYCYTPGLFYLPSGQLTSPNFWRRSAFNSKLGPFPGLFSTRKQQKMDCSEPRFPPLCSREGSGPRLAEVCPGTGSGTPGPPKLRDSPQPRAGCPTRLRMFSKDGGATQKSKEIIGQSVARIGTNPWWRNWAAEPAEPPINQERIANFIVFPLQETAINAVVFGKEALPSKKTYQICPVYIHHYNLGYEVS